MPSPKCASRGSFCIGSGVSSLRESEEPSPLWNSKSMWEVCPHGSYTPMLCTNECKGGRAPFHCSKARAHPLSYLQGSWLPHCEVLACTNSLSEDQERGGSQKLVWHLFNFVLLLTWESGFFSFWFKILGVLRFIGIRIFGFVGIWFGTRED